MEIKNPRRILSVGAPDAGVLKLLQALTDSAPEPLSGTTAGLTHDWRLETKYYTTTIPIWIDEIANVHEWRTEFVKPEAREVITALGGWIYCFKKPVEEQDASVIRDTMQAIADVIECACGFGGDQVCLAVAMPQSTTPHLEKSGEEWEELAADYGFEYVDFEATGKNEFGEPMGVQRIREALEAGEWESNDVPDFGDEEEEEAEFYGSFAAEEVEMKTELRDMKGALHGSGERDEEPGENEVEALEAMMKKMVAIKEMSQSMEESERKRFAAKAVNDLMKDF